jgi:hypothetical protein
MRARGGPRKPLSPVELNLLFHRKPGYLRDAGIDLAIRAEHCAVMTHRSPLISGDGSVGQIDRRICLASLPKALALSDMPCMWI